MKEILLFIYEIIYEKVFDCWHVAVNTVTLYVGAYHGELFLFQQSQSNHYMEKLLFNLWTPLQFCVCNILYETLLQVALSISNRVLRVTEKY